MIDGVKIKIGDAEYTIPPLNFKAIKRLQTEIAKMADIQVGATITAEQLDAMVCIVHSALVRNYPDMTEDQVAEIVDLGNAGTIIQAIMGVSGFVQGEKNPGESL